MRLGLIGQGPWANTYARTLVGLGMDFWQAGRDYRRRLAGTDGVIVACAAEAHYDVAFDVIEDGYPVLIEKPVTLKSAEAKSLLRLAAWRNGNIVFAGHTRLYSPAWREFKTRILKPYRVEGWAGGTSRDPWWDWGPHLVAMSMDLGWDKPVIHVSQEKQPLVLTVNEECVFQDVPTDPMPLEVLVREFVAAIESGKPNNEGLQLGLRVVQYLESHEPSRLHGA